MQALRGNRGYELHSSLNFGVRVDGRRCVAGTHVRHPWVRAEIVTAQGADGANGVGDDPYAVPEEGESVTATAGSIQPVSDPSNSAFATGGNGGNGGNVPGNGTGAPGGAARATAATAVNSGSAEADATAIGGNGGNIGGNNQNDGYGGYASANSTAVTNGSGDASSSANATGGATGFGDLASRAAPLRWPMRRRRVAERRLPPRSRQGGSAIQSAFHLTAPMQRRTPRP